MVVLLHPKILRSMYASQPSAAQCATIPGWYEAFFYLILSGPESLDHDETSTFHQKNERHREEQDLVDTVLEIVFCVMWKGINGYDEKSWKVCAFYFNLFNLQILNTVHFFCIN